MTRRSSWPSLCRARGSAHQPKGVMQMYAKPALERFGTLRELTLVGLSGAADPVSVLAGIGGCTTPFVGSVGCPAAGS
jgi:hypothetical protein